MAGKRILLVEGRDDEHVFKNLIGFHKLGILDDFKEKGGKDGLLECKTPSGRMTPAQVEWHSGWRGRAAVVYGVDAALCAIGAVDGPPPPNATPARRRPRRRRRPRG